MSGPHQDRDTLRGGSVDQWKPTLLLCYLLCPPAMKPEASGRQLIPNQSHFLTCNILYKLRAYWTILFLVPCTGASTKYLNLSCKCHNMEPTNVWEFICAWFKKKKSYLGISWIWSAQKCFTVVCWFSYEEAACQGSDNTLPDCECNYLHSGQRYVSSILLCLWIPKRFFCVLPCKKLEMIKCLLPLGPCKHDIEYL